MISRRVTVVVSTVCAGVGYYAGRKDSQNSTITRFFPDLKTTGDNSSLLGQGRFPSRTFVEDETPTPSLEDSPSWYRFLPIPMHVSAASAPLERSSLPSTVGPTAVTTPTNRVGEIMKFGYPNFDNVLFYEDYVVAYDRRNRTAHWVFEHIKGENCLVTEGVNRENSTFKEDDAIHRYFRASNADYKGSGYDRGHLAAASNHRHCQKAMDQTFLLSNIAPQVTDCRLWHRGIHIFGCTCV